MSGGNVDLVRTICEPWAWGDFSASDWADPGIEIVMADGPTPGTVRGLAGMAQWWADFLRAWADLRAEAEEFRELDDSRVLVLIKNHGRGKGSGFELGRLAPEGANVFHLHGGKVRKLEVYGDRDRALADLGLAD